MACTDKIKVRKRMRKGQGWVECLRQRSEDQGNGERALTLTRRQLTLRSTHKYSPDLIGDFYTGVIAKVTVMVATEEGPESHNLTYAAILCP